jgi:kynurenine formamidase
MNIHYTRIVDLTHPISVGMPAWPGDPVPHIEPVAEIDRDAYRLNVLTIGEHSGTHVGVPAHFYADGTPADLLPPAALIRPAVVVHIADQVVANPDYQLGLADLRAWEGQHGPVAPDAIVLLCAGWAKRWRNPVTYFNADPDGRMHYPGFSAEVTRFLIEVRQIGGLGIDTPGVDPGLDETFAANKLLLGGHRIHLENLTNLDQLPATGATLFVGLLPIVGGSGSPARVLALVP